MGVLFKTLFIMLFLFQSILLTAQNWHSTLYPENWAPGFSDTQGRFFHDFSFAGYRSGLEAIPNSTNNIVDVTKSPYNADRTGILDATLIIQQAIDNVGENGGGVVFLPEGEYRISITGSNSQALRIKYNNVVIRGDGSTKTFIKSSSTNIRNKQLIYFYPDAAGWYSPLSGTTTLILQDLLLPTTTIPVEDPSLFKKGDFVVLGSDLTAAFIAEHGCTSYWTTFKAVRFYREITAVDYSKNSIEIDAPTRYFLKMRDNARMYKINPQLTECGIEDLSIGNVQNNGGGWGDSDYDVAGTGAYEVHASHFIFFRNALNCWARNVETYHPKENTQDIHILSNCMKIADSRFITVEHCNFQRPQYEGDGGDGYLYTLEANDCLIKDCHAEHGRHNYDFKEMTSSGNVILKCTSKEPRLQSDFHMALSMANLFDSFESEGDCIDANFRPYGSAGDMHMYSTTQSVIWNTKGTKGFGGNSNANLVVSRQYGQGYVVGTSGVVNSILTTPISGTEGGIPFNTGPADFVEGLGMGATLLPQSLYLDQFYKRIQRTPLNESFEDFDLNVNSNYVGRSWVSNSDNVDITSTVVVNPNKTGINISDKVLEISRKENLTIKDIDASENSCRGVSTNAYNLKMDQLNSTMEFKMLKKTAGKIAVRIYADGTNYTEVLSSDLPASTEWRVVSFNFSKKIQLGLTSKSRFVIQPERNTNPVIAQTNSLTIYIDDVKIVASAFDTIIENVRDQSVFLYYDFLTSLITLEHLPAGPCTVILTNLSGVKCKSLNIDPASPQINISTLPQGVYIVSCYSATEKIFVGKVIKS